MKHRLHCSSTSYVAENKNGISALEDANLIPVLDPQCPMPKNLLQVLNKVLFMLGITIVRLNSMDIFPFLSSTFTFQFKSVEGCVQHLRPVRFRNLSFTI